MSRKDQRAASMNCRRTLVRYMAERFREHRAKGRNPTTALQLVDGDLNTLMRKNPDAKTQLERARSEFYTKLNQLLEVPA